MRPHWVEPISVPLTPSVHDCKSVGGQPENIYPSPAGGPQAAIRNIAFIERRRDHENFRPGVYGTSWDIYSFANQKPGPPRALSGSATSTARFAPSCKALSCSGLTQPEPSIDFSQSVSRTIGINFNQCLE